MHALHDKALLRAVITLTHHSQPVDIALLLSQVVTYGLTVNPAEPGSLMDPVAALVEPTCASSWWPEAGIAEFKTATVLCCNRLTPPVEVLLVLAPSRRPGNDRDGHTSLVLKARFGCRYASDGHQASLTEGSSVTGTLHSKIASSRVQQ